MKKHILPGAAALLLLCSSCKKTLENIIEKADSSPLGQTDADGFTAYTIKAGQHYTTNNTYKLIETAELKFAVRFDSSAIYQTSKEENQYDINKLYGFSDNEAEHHDFSARLGWRWSDGALRLFGYVYNRGARLGKEITAIPIGKEVVCSIKVAGGQYIFTVEDAVERLPRMSTTPLAKGYQLYPYFGGNENAPHDITIHIKTL